MFQIGDLSSFLAGGLTCIRRGDLFVSWSGCREDQTPQSILMNNSTIPFQLSSIYLNSPQILEAKAHIFV